MGWDEIGWEKPLLYLDSWVEVEREKESTFPPLGLEGRV